MRDRPVDPSALVDGETPDDFDADDDFLRGEWGFIHTANELWGCDLNAFEGKEWRRHIAVLDSYRLSSFSRALETFSETLG